MQYKILEQNGIDNENTDGAAFNNFCAGGRDGIIKEILNECAIIKISDNTLAVSKGELLIHGVRIKIEELISFTLSSTPISPVRYQLIGDLILTANRSIEFSIICRVLQTGLIQEALYKNNSGHYQAEIARFTHSPTNGIEDIARTMDIITGGSSGIDGAALNIGNVTTQTLAAGLDAEVDVENRYDEIKGIYVVDFNFAIPQGQDADVISTGIYPEMTVGYATNADTAENATNAQNAEHAENATYATNADNATNAQNAQNAANATSANKASQATKLQTSRGIDGIHFDGTLAINHYATCSTSASTSAKTVVTNGTFNLVQGARVEVKFTYANTARSPTLNVNSTGAKAIYAGAASSDIFWEANETITFVYDGTYWRAVNRKPCAKYNSAGTNVTNVTGQQDTVVRYYRSSDGNSWYRIWASGWKECGGYVAKRSNNNAVSIGYPLSFVSTPCLTATPIYNADNYTISCVVKSIDAVSCLMQVRTQSGVASEAFNWYACGY